MAPGAERGQGPRHFDPEPLLHAIGGDAESYAELAGQFVASTRRQMAAVTLAVDRGDADALRRQLHSLKGSLGIFHARGALEVVLRMESDARLDEPMTWKVGAAHLDSELEALHAEITAYCAPRGPAPA
jgi:HPt (histidine-containing phosphotransfer) domain-containing protein